MGLFSQLKKHGTAAVAGFLLGLLAIAWIQPETTNGKVLLVVTVMCIAILIGEAILLALRLRRGGKGGPEDG